MRLATTINQFDFNPQPKADENYSRGLLHQMILIHSNHQFEFNVSNSQFKGVFILNAEKRAELRKLVESEPEDWYLDQAGERLSADQLFQASPWSMQTAQGRIKILIRSLDLETGEALFNVHDSYGGEWFRWLREKSLPE